MSAGSLTRRAPSAWSAGGAPPSTMKISGLHMLSMSLCMAGAVDAATGDAAASIVGNARAVPLEKILSPGSNVALESFWL